MTEAMPFLRKLILLSYAPRPCRGDLFFPLFTFFSGFAKIFLKTLDCKPT